MSQALSTLIEWKPIEYCSFYVIQNFIKLCFCIFQLFLKFGAWDLIVWSTQIVFYYQLFLTFCLLQNEKILFSSDFMRFQNMWKRMQARFGLSWKFRAWDIIGVVHSNCLLLSDVSYILSFTERKNIV